VSTHGRSQHQRQELMAEVKPLLADAIMRHQQPAAAALVDGMLIMQPAPRPRGPAAPRPRGPAAPRCSTGRGAWATWTH
jgi:hypothetical protein